jgi:hypothetical protein
MRELSGGQSDRTRSGPIAGWLAGAGVVASGSPVEAELAGESGDRPAVIVEHVQFQFPSSNDVRMTRSPVFVHGLPAVTPSVWGHDRVRIRSPAPIAPPGCHRHSPGTESLGPDN